MNPNNTPFSFMDRNADLNAYTLEPILSAAAHRESWFDDLERNVMKLSKSYVAKELDYGYQAVQAVVTEQRIPATARYRMHGALSSWLRNGLEHTYHDLINMEDLAFTKTVQQDPELVLRVEGAYRALNLFKDPKQKPLLLPSDRINALRRLQEVRLVHFSHSWQGPYKAALVHGKDQVLRIDFSDSFPLYTKKSHPYDASDWLSFMMLTDTSKFRSFLSETVPVESQRSIHRLLLELLTAEASAA